PHPGLGGWGRAPPPRRPPPRGGAGGPGGDRAGPAAPAAAATLIVRSGAPLASLADCHLLVDQAWKPLDDQIPPSYHKAMIPTLGWYAAQRSPDPATTSAATPG
ncbi:hypothetical protein, partial [Kitasatospora purpeofusca]|uniref:hypothetical protein n=1 Tax=Kitasatospora purpeofusca TaxID=67352 RepID=UPI00364A0055